MEKLANPLSKVLTMCNTLLASLIQSESDASD